MSRCKVWEKIGILLLPNNQRQHRTLHVQKDTLPYALAYGRVQGGCVFLWARYPCNNLQRARLACTPARPLIACVGVVGNHAGLFVGVFQKSILNRVCQLLAIRAHKMAPRTSRTSLGYPHIGPFVGRLFHAGVALADLLLHRGRSFIERMTSDRKLKASREGSK